MPSQEYLTVYSRDWTETDNLSSIAYRKVTCQSLVMWLLPVANDECRLETVLPVLATLVSLHRPLHHELEQLHNHALAAYLHEAVSAGRPQGYHVHCCTLHRQQHRGRR